MLTHEKNIPYASACEKEIIPEMANQPGPETMRLDHIQRLVHLLDRGNLSEIEVKQASTGLRLALRKRNILEGALTPTQACDNSISGQIASDTGSEQTAPQANLSYVNAPLVGIFHPWLKPGGKTLVKPGEQVKPEQVIGIIEALNILNEVKATVSGRIAEIAVQDGQAVEYGQLLFTLES